MTVVALREAGPECGGKAYALGVLIRAGLPVPDGFVVTDSRSDAPEIVERLRGFGGAAVAVRSSGRSEDSAAASFAGQLDTVLGVTSAEDVLAAVERCAASARTPRARAYRRRLGGDEADVPVIVPVIVQVLVEADRAGVLFTRDPRDGGDSTVVNASWGLGESVVSGAVDPDEFVIMPDGTVRVAVGGKQTRVDLRGNGVTRSAVTGADRARACLSPDDLAELVRLGRRCEDLFGRPQDVEWAARDGRIWIVQSRPITTLAGTATGPGRATGPVRVVRTVDDFARVRRGDVLVCRTTDPAWTPLFGLAAAIVTETGGLLCHAAIVAREYGIPAIVGAAGATTRLRDDDRVTVDGALGTVTSAGVR